VPSSFTQRIAQPNTKTTYLVKHRVVRASQARLTGSIPMRFIAHMVAETTHCHYAKQSSETLSMGSVGH
jgi:hypothetical protein